MLSLYEGFIHAGLFAHTMFTMTGAFWLIEAMYLLMDWANEDARQTAKENKPIHYFEEIDSDADETQESSDAIVHLVTGTPNIEEVENRFDELLKQRLSRKEDTYVVLTPEPLIPVFVAASKPIDEVTEHNQGLATYGESRGAVTEPDGAMAVEVEVIREPLDVLNSILDEVREERGLSSDATYKTHGDVYIDYLEEVVSRIKELPCGDMDTGEGDEYTLVNRRFDALLRSEGLDYCIYSESIVTQERHDELVRQEREFAEAWESCQSDEERKELLKNSIKTLLIDAMEEIAAQRAKPISQASVAQLNPAQTECEEEEPIEELFARTVVTYDEVLEYIHETSESVGEEIPTVEAAVTERVTVTKDKDDEEVLEFAPSNEESQKAHKSWIDDIDTSDDTIAKAHERVSKVPVSELLRNAAKPTRKSHKKTVTTHTRKELQGRPLNTGAGVTIETIKNLGYRKAQRVAKLNGIKATGKHPELITRLMNAHTHGQLLSIPVI